MDEAARDCLVLVRVFCPQKSLSSVLHPHESSLPHANFLCEPFQLRTRHKSTFSGANLLVPSRVKVRYVLNSLPPKISHMIWGGGVEKKFAPPRKFTCEISGRPSRRRAQLFSDTTRPAHFQEAPMQEKSFFERAKERKPISAFPYFDQESRASYKSGGTRSILGDWSLSFRN